MPTLTDELCRAWLCSLSLALTLAFYAALVFAIWKIFQIGRDVSEIKRMLSEDTSAHN